MFKGERVKPSINFIMKKRENKIIANLEFHKQERNLPKSKEIFRPRKQVNLGTFISGRFILKKTLKSFMII